MNISLIIPVYNSQGTLTELHSRVTKVMLDTANNYEIIFIDDGSTDLSWPILQHLSSHDCRTRAIRLLQNSGQHNAILCGIRAASHPIIVTLDDDLQHPPEEIPKLLAEFGNGHDVVYGVYAEGQHGLLRNLASRTTKVMLRKAMGVSAACHVSAFRVFKTCLRDAFADYRGPMPNIDVLLSWGTKRFGSAPVLHEPRRTGSSGYNFFKLTAHALNMITGFTVLPLQLSSILGFSLTLVGIILLFFIIGRYILSGTPIQGFPFLASIICFFSGAQLFALGILGEYFARMHLRMMDKPVYTEGERINFPHQPQKRP